MIKTNESYIKAGKDLLSHFRKCGFDSWLVGGVVRDHFLEREPKDVDVVFWGRGVELFCIFPRAVRKGSGKRSTFIVFYEGKTFEVEPLEKGTLASDLRRRDFTVNAIAMDAEQNIIDPFGGIKDLKRSLLRFTGDPEGRINEDPVRMIRFCRMISTLGLTPERSSSLAVKRCSGTNPEIPPERIGQEVLKALEESALSVFLDCLNEHGLVSLIFPAMSSSRVKKGIIEGLRCLEMLSMSQNVMAASLLVDVPAPREVLEKWNWPIALKRDILSLLAGLEILSSYGSNERDIALLALDPGVPTSELVFFSLFSGAGCCSYFDRDDILFRNLDIFTSFARNIQEGPSLPDGRMIMETMNILPGKKVGKAKEEILFEIARGRIRTEDDIKLYLKSLCRE